MSYTLVFSNQALSDLEFHVKSGNKPLLRKIYNLLEEVSKHPFFGTGKPELLKYELEGYWSRKIDDKHRLLYKVSNDTVSIIIISARGHYGDR